jgi:catechol 2,3-dioxygenase-like lactoylglutathione lyase family enzyme
MGDAIRFHLSLNVTNLGRSVAFYRTLFGIEPAKERPDYAKFELAEPPLVLSLEPNQHATGGALNHLGFRLPDSPALVEFQSRLEAAGISTRREEGVECCYARQTKFWVTDPDRTLWEIYVLEDDIDHRGAGQTLEAMLHDAKHEAEPITWQHRLGDPVPERIPLADGTASEVLLLGTMNSVLPDGSVEHLAREAYRVLSPGGRIVLHNLVADRSFPNGFPGLGGPAAAVERVPLESEPVRALETAGFVGVALSKFGSAPCFQLDGVQMREMMLQATKPSGQGVTGHRAIVYRGPFPQVTDEDGTVFRRGERVTVNAAAAERLSSGPYADHFTLLTSGGKGCS